MYVGPPLLVSKVLLQLANKSLHCAEKFNTDLVAF